MLRYSLSLIFVALLSGCGGGGGSSSPSSSTSSTDCINVQEIGCQFNINDPQQSASGWWNGTRTMVSTGRIQSAYLIANDIGSYAAYLGNGFDQGQFSGSYYLLGSTFTTLTASGADSAAQGLGGVSFTGATGGAITRKILGISAPQYVTYIGGPSGPEPGKALSQPALFRFIYNSLGDQPLSGFIGSYSTGTTSATIDASGRIVLSYKPGIYIPYNSTQICTISQSVTPTTPMSKVSVSGVDSCNNTVKLSFFFYTASSGARIGFLVGIPVAGGTSVAALTS